MNNEIIISGKILEIHEQFKKDGINYGTILIQTKSKYEMNQQLITCTFAGKIFDDEWNNLKVNINVKCLGHVIEEENILEIIIDEIKYIEN